jgi:anti-sigma factor RsiW
MNCEQIGRVLRGFVEGTLRAEESRAVRMHLASCAACASRLSPSERMEILPALDDEIEPSEDFAARFHSRLQQRRGHLAIGRNRSLWWRSVCAWGHPWKLAAAGALAAIVAAGIFIGRYPRGIPEPSEYFNELAIAENLPLLQDMAVISNLDLLEDFDTIEKLTPRLEGSKMQRSNP